MTSFGELARRIRMLLQRERVASELAEEMEMHLELRRREQIEAGVAPEAAGAAAKRRFGNATLQRERSYAAWGWSWLEGLLHDIAYGLRAMRRSPGVTVIALLSLALGIGANTAIFSLMDAVMLRSLPVKQPDQLVLLGKGQWMGISDGVGVTELYSYAFYRQFQKKNQVFSDTAAMFSMPNDVHGSISSHRQQEPMHVQLVSGTYFGLLGVHAIHGRVLTEEDDRTEGGSPVAVVSYAWWTRDLGRDPEILNRTLKIGETTYTIIGVTPPEFFGTKVGESPDIWIPFAMVKQVPPNFDIYKGDFAQSLYILGRLKPGVTVAQATTNVNLLYQQILRSFLGVPLSQQNEEALKKASIVLSPMAKGLSMVRAEFSDPLKILMGIVGLVLLIACANIANLLLARATVRTRELAVRQALGAGRSRLIRQLLTESLILALAGGVLGVAFAVVAVRVLLRMVSGGPETVPLDVSLNLHMLLFMAGITLFTALLFGTLPAFRATRLELTRSLKDGQGGSAMGSKGPVAKALIVSQVAFSLVLVVASGLFLRSLVNLSHVDMGFNKEHVLRLQLDASSVGYKEDDPRLHALYQQIEQKVKALPGVEAASFSSFVFHEGSWNGSVTVPGAEKHPDVNVKHNIVGDGYFQTMQIPLLAGRGFGPQDTATSQRVAVIGERMARTLFPKGNPIGRHYYPGEPKDGTDREVIGIARDVKFGSLQEDPETLDYYPYRQRDMYLNDFVVRYSGDFAAAAAEVRGGIHEIDRNLPITDVTTLDEWVGRSINDQRTVAQLSTFFGMLAVFLSAIGIYGLMSYVVSRRTSEIGIRMALGAQRSTVRWLVMREIAVLVAVGVVIGVPAALAGNRLIAHMLYQVGSNDGVSLLAAVTVMLVIAALAGYLPARRASRVDPMRALRYE